MVMEMVLVFTVVMMETSGGGMEEPTGGDSGSVSPLRSSPAAAFCLLFRVYRVSPLSPRETPRGTLFIVGFRSRRSHGDENGRHRSHEGEKRVPHAARGWASGLYFQPIAFLSKILNCALWPCPFWSFEAPGKSETLKKTFSGKQS